HRLGDVGRDPLRRVTGLPRPAPNVRPRFFTRPGREEQGQPCTNDGAKNEWCDAVPLVALDDHVAAVVIVEIVLVVAHGGSLAFSVSSWLVFSPPATESSTERWKPRRSFPRRSPPARAPATRAAPCVRPPVRRRAMWL